LAPVSLPIGSPLLSFPWGDLHFLLSLFFSSSLPPFPLLLLRPFFSISSFIPLPSPLLFLRPSPFLPPFLTRFPSSLFLPPSFSPISFFCFLWHYSTLRPSRFARFISGPVEALSDPIRAALSNGVIAAYERVHRFSDTLGVHWHNDLILLGFVSIVVESHWKYSWRRPYFCFSHHPF
jgi:hypothetical protein